MTKAKRARKPTPKSARLPEETTRAAEHLRERFERRLRRELAALRADLAPVLTDPLWLTREADPPDSNPSWVDQVSFIIAWPTRPGRPDRGIRWSPETDAEDGGRFVLMGDGWWRGPPVATVSEALAFVEAATSELATDAATDVAIAANYFAKDGQAIAMLGREGLAADWAWQGFAGPGEPSAWSALTMLRAILAKVHMAEAGATIRAHAVEAALSLQEDPILPGDVTPADVWAWAEDASQRSPRCGLRAVLSRYKRGSPSDTEHTICIALVQDQPADGDRAHVRPVIGSVGWGWGLNQPKDDRIRLWLQGRNLAVLYRAGRDIERDRLRPAVAIDAGRPHHDFLMGLRDLPKDTRRGHRIAEIEPGRLELIAPGRRSVQLTLDLEGTPGGALTRALMDLRGPGGLRHWVALQRLWSVEGGRLGEVLWSLDAHLEALGYSAAERRRSEMRTRVVEEVRLLTQLQLVVYDADGRPRRERLPLVIRVSEIDEQQDDGAWHTSAMRLRINPLLYEGVRAEGGTLGTNWHPAPVELAKVDHRRHPHTIPLGVLLPIRWRLDLRTGRDAVALTGENLLRLAGIRYQPRKAGEAWTKLERDLTELRRIGGVGQWGWSEGGPSLAAVCQLSPADWAADRTLRGVRPHELPAGPAALTGTELKTWRKARGLSQSGLAGALGVNQATVSRLEGRGGELIPADVTAKLRALGA